MTRHRLLIKAIIFGTGLILTSTGVVFLWGAEAQDSSGHSATASSGQTLLQTITMIGTEHSSMRNKLIQKFWREDNG